MKKTVSVFILLFLLFAVTALLLQPVILPHLRKLFTKITGSQDYSQTSQAVVIGTGDTNNDGVVDFSDVYTVLGAWEEQTQPPTDQYADGKINSYDFTVITQHLGQK